MRVLVNFAPRQGPYGGANSFLRTLVHELEGRGVTFTRDPNGPADVALLNALTDGLELEQVRAIAEREIPIVHRKTGYRGRGIPELRAELDGAIVGDARQVEFDPYVTHSVFQSGYSRDVFLSTGFAGAYTVQPNGVDPAVFNTVIASRFRRARPREWWRRGEPLRVVISTWSTDDSKGFPYYVELDRSLGSRTDLVVTLVGRVPDGARFGSIRVVAPKPAPKLAALLKQQHVLLQLTSWESCSNALLEGINCGLPAVYLDSGANDEIGGAYGVAWGDTLDEALERLLPRYEAIVERVPANPYRIGPVADRYLAILEAVAAGREVTIA